MAGPFGFSDELWRPRADGCEVWEGRAERPGLRRDGMGLPFRESLDAPRGWSDRKRTASRRSHATDRGPTAVLEPCRY